MMTTSISPEGRAGPWARSLVPAELAELRHGGDPAIWVALLPGLVAAVLLLHPRLAQGAAAHGSHAVHAENPWVPLRLDDRLVAWCGLVLQRQAEVNRLRDFVEEKLNRLCTGSITWNRDVNELRVGVGVAEGDARDADASCFCDSGPLLDRIDNNHDVRVLVHVLDPTVLFVVLRHLAPE